MTTISFPPETPIRRATEVTDCDFMTTRIEANPPDDGDERSDPSKPHHKLPASVVPEREGVRILESESLLEGRREVWIRHGNEMYRLRATAAGRLHLSK